MNSSLVAVLALVVIAIGMIAGGAAVVAWWAWSRVVDLVRGEVRLCEEWVNGRFERERRDRRSDEKNLQDLLHVRLDGVEKNLLRELAQSRRSTSAE